MANWHDPNKLMISISVDNDGLLKYIAEIESQMETLERTVTRLKGCLMAEEKPAEKRQA